MAPLSAASMKNNLNPLSVFKMNIIGTYAYFQSEVLYIYKIYRDFLASLSHFLVLAPLQYW